MASKSIAVNRRKSPFVLQETNVLYVFVLGEKECGKSSLIRALTTHEVEDSNLPSLTVFESRELLSRILYIFRFCELSEETFRLEEVKRTCQQHNTVLFYCFAVIDINSLHTINLNWIAPLRLTIGFNLPSVLVGTKLDLRRISEERMRIVKSSWGERMRKCFDLQQYHECSVLKEKTIFDLFYIVLGLAMMEDSNLQSLSVFQSRESISEKVFVLLFCELTEETNHLEEVKQTCQQQSTVLFFCFAVDDVYSLYAINLDWIATLRLNIGIKLPSILVGNKIDLRGHTSSFGKRLFNFSCGDKMRKVFDLCLYHECSSVSGKAIPDLSWLAIALALDPHFVV
ncbi:hypothetical protein CDAR_224331 [Caerostris darwini]|uniref:Uncharacterized protein n=1 Tax=Caerostris darwini TaxID=1538125 RepID=A0AAV4WZ16_9ARAC|nr:hypothetical protein CDAR_224331 [Caerostris darwini]